MIDSVPAENTRQGIRGRKLGSSAEQESADVYDILIRFNENYNSTTRQGTVTEPSPQQCLISILIADTNEDSLMDTSEYFNFANRLSRQTWAGASGFSALPQLMQDNFFMISAGDPTINIFGAKPGQDTSTDQMERLYSLCDSVVVTANDIFTDWGGSAPTPPPVLPDPPTPEPAPVSPSTFQACYDDMVSSDADRNRHLDSDEYVEFCNLISNGQLGATSFDTLDVTLQTRYFDLESNGGIDGILIEGARPGSDPGPDQTAFLERMCLDVGRSVEVVLNSPPPTPAPIPAPTFPTPSPTTFPPTPDPTPSPTTASPIATNAPTLGPTTAEPTTPAPSTPVSMDPTTYSPTVTESTAPSLRPSTTEAGNRGISTDASSNSTTGIVVGSVVGGSVLLAAILCVLGGYFFWRGRQQQQRQSEKGLPLSDEQMHLYDADDDATENNNVNGSQQTHLGLATLSPPEEAPSRIGRSHRRGSNVITPKVDSFSSLSDRQ